MKNNDDKGYASDNESSSEDEKKDQKEKKGKGKAAEDNPTVREAKSEDTALGREQSNGSEESFSNHVSGGDQEVDSAAGMRKEMDAIWDAYEKHAARRNNSGGPDLGALGADAQPKMTEEDHLAAVARAQRKAAQKSDTSLTRGAARAAGKRMYGPK